MYSEEGKFEVTVCFSPLSWNLYRKDNATVIVTDIFRATTSIVAAFDNGVKSIIPVADISESENYKKQGYIVSGEREGKTLPIAEFGNSPFNFMQPRLTGQTVVMNTTNGTQALKLVKEGNNKVGIGAFTNLEAICNWAMQNRNDIIIFCAGWKNKFSMEDTLFAGAAAEFILSHERKDYHTMCDSTIASIYLWKTAKIDLRKYADKIAHRHRLRRMGLDDIIDYSLQLSISSAVPVLSGNEIFDIRSSRP